MVKNIVLDFGHGGIDNNGHYTTAPAKMFKFPSGEIAYEGVINRQIGGILYHLLQSNHPELNIEYTVKPDDPRDVSLGYRVRVANKYPASNTIFVSIHSNAGGGKGRGFEIFTTRGITKSDKLAEDIANEVEKLYKNVGLKLRYDFSDGDKDKEADFYVIRKTNCPATLLECLFFDNVEDYSFLKNPKFQQELAFAIYNGIINYVKNN
ncbi:MAG: N-acetylmuramoyl-L-alanine amidase [Romboutsia sp.]|nr:N-acetylmuramoyl-L-alanine amidase [Romboutsia sp.]